MGKEGSGYLRRGSREKTPLGLGSSSSGGGGKRPNHVAGFEVVGVLKDLRE